MYIRTPIYLFLLALLPLIFFLGRPAQKSSLIRAYLSLLVRVVITGSLIFALAGLELHQAVDQLAVAFLLDSSDSVPTEQRDQSYNSILEALKAMPTDDLAGLVVFGSEALVDQPIAAGKDWGAVTSAPRTQETDLEEAIRLAHAIFPPGTARRIVLFGDGEETTGDALKAARQARFAGIDLIWSRRAAEALPEVALSTVRSPAALIEGERFDLVFTILASVDTPAQVRVFTDGETIIERPLEIIQGERSYNLPLVAGPPGFARYQVQVVPEQDTYFQNNTLAAFSQIKGPLALLMVAPPAGTLLPFQGSSRPDEHSNLSRALVAAGFELDVVSPSGLPSALTELVGYAAVILVDVPAGEINPAQLKALKVYVGDLGGGLVAVGGPTSFGVGGYFRTPLEEILPVDMQIKNEARKPPVTILFIIDQSGSMAENSGGASKLELAKEAVIRSIQLMFPGDQVGVVTFDDSARWAVPITPLADPKTIIQAVGSIRSGGGTDILAGIEAAAVSLPGVESPVKHIILLTDGGADPAGIPELVNELKINHGITLSAVGVGQDAAPFLPTLAELGGGRYHAASTPAAIPSIFTQETTLVGRAYLIEEEFQPELGSASPILMGIDTLPPLQGYIATSPKIAATSVLLSPQGDPILATWQYGLGKTAAFTSDATSRWAGGWINWDGYPVFWSQVIRFVARVETAFNLDTRIEREGEQARIQLDGLTGQGELLNNIQVSANVVFPDQKTTTFPLTQFAPGLYEGFFEPEEQGVYLITLIGEPDEQEPGGLSETIGWVQSYGPEYKSWPTGETSPGIRLEQAGVFRLSGNSDDYFRHDLPTPTQIVPIWEVLLGLAALLLPADIALRRLSITRTELRSGWRRLISRRGKTSDFRESPMTHEPHLQVLINARQRVRDQSPEASGSEPPHAQGQPDITQEEPIPAPDTTLDTAATKENPSEESLAAALLARKKYRKR